MRLLGLTGNIACGKSTVARLLAGFGAVVIDADQLVHELYQDKEFAQRVAALFEVPVLDSSGTVDRTTLGPVVFHDCGALKRLETLVHPAVAALREERIGALRELPEPPETVVIEAVKLVESGQAATCDVVWLVTSKVELQVQRLMQKRGLSRTEAEERLANQPSLEKKRQLLGSLPIIVIENNGSLDELQRKVAWAWQQWSKSPKSPKSP